ncbi:hypothetical protein R3P38DRAFT_2764145 [Favolaschia claudopus]|uniref:Uncharacterized protein n=1 Tax=Favolaschia claudopus TaxID=2862362 RepID=A0AAW0D635_9AGAR
MAHHWCGSTGKRKGCIFRMRYSAKSEGRANSCLAFPKTSYNKLNHYYLCGISSTMLGAFKLVDLANYTVHAEMQDMSVILVIFMIALNGRFLFFLECCFEGLTAGGSRGQQPAYGCVDPSCLTPAERFFLIDCLYPNSIPVAGSGLLGTPEAALLSLAAAASASYQRGFPFVLSLSVKWGGDRRRLYFEIRIYVKEVFVYRVLMQGVKEMPTALSISTSSASFSLSELTEITGRSMFPRTYRRRRDDFPSEAINHHRITGHLRKSSHFRDLTSSDGPWYLLFIKKLDPEQIEDCLRKSAERSVLLHSSFSSTQRHNNTSWLQLNSSGEQELSIIYTSTTNYWDLPPLCSLRPEPKPLWGSDRHLKLEFHP